MNEHCLHAQEIISATYDGEPVVAEDLLAAKDHCRSCASCARFVSSLAALRAVPGPVAPAATTENAIARIRAEAQQIKLENARAAAAEHAAPQRDNIPGDTLRESRAAGAHLPRTRTGWVAALGSLAAILTLAVIGTSFGLRYMLPPKTGLDQAASESAAVTQGDPATETWDALTDSAGAARLSTAASELRYVVFSGFVYKVDTRTTSLDSGAEPIGSVTTDLGTGVSTTFEVFPGDSEFEIVVSDGDRGYNATLVQRQLEQDVFGLQSGPIIRFGEWPTLPVGFAQPTDEDGGPTFVEEDSGYYLPGRGASSGIAIAPGSPDDDPAAGNPNWTWWAPLR